MDGIILNITLHACMSNWRINIRVLKGCILRWKHDYDIIAQNTRNKIFLKCAFPFKFISCFYPRRSFAVLFTICGEMKQFKILIQYKYSNETTLSLRTHRYYCRRRRTRCVIFLTKTCFHYVKNLLFSLKFVLERILHIAVQHTHFLY